MPLMTYRCIWRSLATAIHSDDNDVLLAAGTVTANILANDIMAYYSQAKASIHRASNKLINEFLSNRGRKRNKIWHKGGLRE